MKITSIDILPRQYLILFVLFSVGIWGLHADAAERSEAKNLLLISNIKPFTIAFGGARACDFEINRTVEEVKLHFRRTFSQDEAEKYIQRIDYISQLVREEIEEGFVSGRLSKATICEGIMNETRELSLAGESTFYGRLLDELSSQYPDVREKW